MSRSRVAYAVVALLALVGLLASFIAGPSVPAPMPLRTLRFFCFFTVLTNILVAAAATGLALPPGHRWRAFAERPAIRTAISDYIFVVALIFHLLLMQMVRPGFAGWLGNMLVHQLAPTGWLLCWLAFGPHGGIDARAPLRWLLYPLAYSGWTLAHGALSGWYPYPFMDVATLGYPLVLRNLTAIALVFLALGYALRWVDGLLGRRTAQ